MRYKVTIKHYNGTPDKTYSVEINMSLEDWAQAFFACERMCVSSIDFKPI